MAREYITITEGLRGHFAVHVINEEPEQTSPLSFKTPLEAARDAISWARAEGIPYEGPDPDAS